MTAFNILQILCFSSFGICSLVLVVFVSYYIVALCWALSTWCSVYLCAELMVTEAHSTNGLLLRKEYGRRRLEPDILHESWGLVDWPGMIPSLNCAMRTILAMR